MSSIIKLILFLLPIFILGTVGIVAANHYSPTTLPAPVKQYADTVEKNGMELFGDYIPNRELSPAEKLKKTAKETKRIAKEELSKQARLAQQKAQYEYDKAFEKWYKVSEACIKSQNTTCINHRRTAKEEFQRIWKSK